jgi:uncharacterized cupredoxin-like copper-binding protein
MKITKEMVMKNAKNVLTVVAFAAVATASFQLGAKYQSDKKEQVAIENPYDHAFSPEEISIAVNESAELIMIERKTGKYIVYSDAIGQTIFGMYANRIHQEANGIK